MRGPHCSRSAAVLAHLFKSRSQVARARSRAPPRPTIRMSRAYLVAIVRNTSIRIQDMGNARIFLRLPFHILRMTSGAKIGQKWEKMLRSGALWGNMRAVENDRAGFRNALQTKSNPPQNAARKGTRGRHRRHRRDKISTASSISRLTAKVAWPFPRSSARFFPKISW